MIKGVVVIYVCGADGGEVVTAGIEARDDGRVIELVDGLRLAYLRQLDDIDIHICARSEFDGHVATGGEEFVTRHLDNGGHDAWWVDDQGRQQVLALGLDSEVSLVRVLDLMSLAPRDCEFVRSTRARGQSPFSCLSHWRGPRWQPALPAGVSDEGETGHWAKVSARITSRGGVSRKDGSSDQVN